MTDGPTTLPVLLGQGHEQVARHSLGHWLGLYNDLHVGSSPISKKTV
jgi:hypothetical protein